MDSKRQRPPAIPLDPRAVVIMRELVEVYAPKYAKEYLLSHLTRILGPEINTREAVAEAVEDPLASLQVFFGHYAFSRRGKDREDLANVARAALTNLVQETSIEEVLSSPDGSELWNSFESVCKSKQIKCNEQQNRGPIQGILELAQEIYRQDPEMSLSSWVISGVEETGKLEPQYLRIVDIRGVGPKSTSAFIRDTVWLFDAEEGVEAADRLLLQPVDRWLRLITKYVVPEPDLDDPADWIVAGKVAKYVRRAGLSGIDFNMGAVYFGQKVAQVPEKFEDELRQLLIASQGKS